MEVDPVAADGGGSSSGLVGGVYFHSFLCSSNICFSKVVEMIKVALALLVKMGKSFFFYW